MERFGVYCHFSPILMEGLLIMDQVKIPVVCLDDYTAYYDVTDASWDKQIFITHILKCCDGIWKKIFDTHWKYYDKSMEGMVTWKQC